MLVALVSLGTAFLFPYTSMAQCNSFTSDAMCGTTCMWDTSKCGFGTCVDAGFEDTACTCCRWTTPLPPFLTLPLALSDNTTSQCTLSTHFLNTSFHYIPSHLLDTPSQYVHNISVHPLTPLLNTPFQHLQRQWHFQTKSHHPHQSLHLHRRISSRIRTDLLAHDFRDISVGGTGEGCVTCSGHQFLLEHCHDLFLPGTAGFYRYVVVLS